MKDLKCATELADWLEWAADIAWTTPSVELLGQAERLDLPEGDQNICGACQGMAEASRKSARDRDSVALDYTSLFCGFSRDAPFPYQSVHCSENGYMMQESAVESARSYDAGGYAWRDAGGNEPPDHLATQMRFLAYLLRQDKPKEGIMREFVDSHVCSWWPKLSSEILAKAQTPFFRAYAGLIAGMSDYLCDL